jgi:hypothetical protein
VKNIAIFPTKLTMRGTNSGPALQDTQQSNNAGASGVGVTVPAGKKPITVNTNAGIATNLNADKLDGQDSSALTDTIARTHLLIDSLNTDSTISSHYEPFRTVGNFSKRSATSTIKLTWNGHVSQGGTGVGFCAFQLRIDGGPPPGPFQGGGRTVLWGNEAPTAAVAYFMGLSRDVYTVSIWVRGNATGCTQNSGDFPEDV